MTELTSHGWISRTGIGTGRPFEGPIRCSFCAKEQSQVAKLVAGPTPDIAICNECVDLVREIMNESLA